LPSDLLISIDEARRMNPREVVIMVTGTQGEPSSVLSRLATGSHGQLAIDPGDTVILSAHPIPGNEEMVHRTINRLFQRGANVIYDPIEQVHVSGHASQEELKLLISLVRPRYFIPIHGELRHLKQHALLAQELGVPRERTAVVENGTQLLFDHNGNLSIGERVPGGYVFVDGSIVGDIGPAVMKDREILGRDGIVIVNAVYDAARKELVNDVNLVTRGFVFQREAEDLLESARQVARRVVSQSNGGANKSEMVQDALSRFFYAETRRRPFVFAFVTEV
ncbi:MAG: ribonuclease J, partial [Anaerolineae bacterium]|nr:ribonuclease J [Anaerolineae bacterium]